MRETITELIWVRLPGPLRHRARLIASLLVLAGSLFFLGYAVVQGWDTLEPHVRDIDYRFLGLAFLCYPLGFLPIAWNWHKIMTGVAGFDNRGQNIRVYCLSCLPKRIPGFIWYVASRIALYRERRVDAPAVVAATGVETIILILSGGLTYLVTIGATHLRLERSLAGPAVVVFLLAIVAPILAPILCHGAVRLLRHVGVSVSVDFGARDVMLLLGTSVLAWIGGGGILFLVANSVTAVSLMDLPRVIGAWGAAGAFGLVAGLLVQGMGLREVTLAMLLSGLMPFSVAALVSILFRLLLTVGEVVWALAIAWYAGRFASGLP